MPQLCGALQYELHDFHDTSLTEVA